MAAESWNKRRLCFITLLLVSILSLFFLLQLGRDQDSILPKNVFGYSLENWGKSSSDDSWYHQIELKLKHEQAQKQKELDELKEAQASGEDGNSVANNDNAETDKNDKGQSHSSATNDSQEVNKDVLLNMPATSNHRILYSATSPDREFWRLDLKGSKGYNANIIPHPTDPKLWIIVVQNEQYDENITQSEELACSASFQQGKLVCDDAPTILPIEPSILGVCEGDLAYANLRRGPRDARMFYGPKAPYLMYGSQSSYICFSLWMQDLRPILDAFPYGRFVPIESFRTLTELIRPSDYHVIEKNYFIFWDSQGQAYAHYNIYPKRAFAKLDANGSGIKDIASATEDRDRKCINSYMPKLAPQMESIHQATNSLSITNCSRYDTECVADDSNTFIMHIFHHKTYYQFHGEYEPYVFLFQQSAPFAAHAIGQKPYWINGRGNLTIDSDSVQYRKHPEWIPDNVTEFFYITSMSWKNHGQTYHGFVDDVLFLTFGIEDSRGGAIDVPAGELLKDLAYC